MVARKTAAKKTAAKKTTSKRAAAPEPEVTEETTRRGRTPDMGKYELFAEWAAEEHDFEVDPEQAMFVMTHYKDFQVSDVNREYNERKRSAAAEEREARASRRAEREASREDEEVKPARRTTKKASAASASAPAKKAAAKKAPAKKTAARRRPAAAQEAF